MSTNKDLIMEMLRKSMAEKAVKERRRRKGSTPMDCVPEVDEVAASINEFQEVIKESMIKIPEIQKNGQLLFRYNPNGNIVAFTEDEKTSKVRKLSL